MHPDDRIRLALPQDLPALAGVELAAAQLLRSVGVDASLLEETVPAPVLATAQAEQRLWVAVHKNDCVGFAVALAWEDDSWLEEIDVHPDHGRRGLGRALVQAVLEWSVRRAHGTLSLSTFRDVPWNAPFYEKLGFRLLPVDRYSPTIRDVMAKETASGLPMERRIVLRHEAKT